MGVVLKKTGRKSFRFMRGEGESRRTADESHHGGASLLRSSS